MQFLHLYAESPREYAQLTGIPVITVKHSTELIKEITVETDTSALKPGGNQSRKSDTEINGFVMSVNTV